MRHSNQNRTFGRPRRQRTALLRGLVVALIKEEKIKTTEAKAKEIRPLIERLITLGKKDTVAARRLVATRLGEPKAEIVTKLFNEISQRYSGRPGGYVRVTKLGRTEAGRDEAVIEFV